jgi:hypothetical protein
VRLEFLAAECAREKAAGILPPFEIDEKCSFKLRFRKYHGTLLDWRLIESYMAYRPDDAVLQRFLPLDSQAPRA